MKRLGAHGVAAILLLSCYSLDAQAPSRTAFLVPGRGGDSLEVPPLSCGLDVTYAKGMLKIAASQCRLGDVLEAVLTRAGISIDIAPEAAAEVVSGEFGPATPLVALRAFLEGEKSNYIIIEGVEPGQVQRLVMRMPSQPSVMAKSGSLASGAVPPNVRNSVRETESLGATEQASTDGRGVPTAAPTSDYRPDIGELAPTSGPSTESASFSSNEPLPPSLGPERPSNAPVPGQWPWQIDRSLNGVGYQSPSDYVKQFQTGERH